MIEAAINGTRSKSEHPAIPVYLPEIVEEAWKVTQAGAEAIHFHVRDAEGEETLDPDCVGESLTALRNRDIHTPIGISTGSWIEPDVGRRLDLIRNWEVLPDFVSVNLHEEGFPTLADTVLSKGIDIEAGIFDVPAAKAFLKSNFSEWCLRVLIEPQETAFKDATATVERIIELLDARDIASPRLLHGFEQTAWPMLKLAKKKGYDTRIGFEDCLTLPGGKTAPDNVSMLAAAKKIWHQKQNTFIALVSSLF